MIFIRILRTGIVIQKKRRNKSCYETSLKTIFRINEALGENIRWRVLELEF
jgi:hypothetical protein